MVVVAGELVVHIFCILYEQIQNHVSQWCKPPSFDIHIFITDAIASYEYRISEIPSHESHEQLAPHNSNSWLTLSL